MTMTTDRARRFPATAARLVRDQETRYLGRVSRGDGRVARAGDAVLPEDAVLAGDAVPPDRATARSRRCSAARDESSSGCMTRLLLWSHAPGGNGARL